MGAWCQVLHLQPRLGLTFPLRCVPRLTRRDICLALSMAFLHCFLILACVRLSLQTDMQKQHHARKSMNITRPTPSDRPTRVSWASDSARDLKKQGEEEKEGRGRKGRGGGEGTRGSCQQLKRYCTTLLIGSTSARGGSDRTVTPYTLHITH